MRDHRVAILGGGFGGLQAALGLRRSPVEITLIDRRNFHLFQPLTYQVATGAARRKNRNLDAFRCRLPPVADAMTGARKGPVVFVELDTRQDAGYTVSLEWDRDTGETHIVLDDIRDASLLVFPVPGANAGDAFRHPYRYAP